MHGPLANSSFDLSGQGVKVGIADSGIYQAHQDFSQTLFYDSVAGYAPSYHGTFVASIIGGRGPSTNAYYGHAPDASLGDYEHLQTIYAHYITAIDTDGSQVTNHSYGLNVLDGADGYRLEHGLLDSYVRGTAHFPPAPQVWAAGFCPDPTVTGMIPGCATTDRTSVTEVAKNTILVAAIDSFSCGASENQCEIYESGMGPTLDLRIKPDLVAPGCHDLLQANYQDYVWGASSVGVDLYTTNYGTSMAAPVVTAAIALVMQQAQDNNRVVNFSSSYRALLIHTATDQIGPTPQSVGYHEGPDGATGWGLVNAEEAVRIAGLNDQWLEYTIELSSATGSTLPELEPSLPDAEPVAVEAEPDSEPAPREGEAAMREPNTALPETGLTAVKSDETTGSSATPGSESLRESELSLPENEVTAPEIGPLAPEDVLPRLERCVSLNQGLLKVTIAWDDLPGANCTLLDAATTTDAVACSEVDPKLHQDLDLLLIGPEGEIVHPWVLVEDPASSDTYNFKADKGIDRRNNVEMAQTEADVSGNWRIAITGFFITEDQPFSLVSSHPIQLCVGEDV